MIRARGVVAAVIAACTVCVGAPPASAGPTDEVSLVADVAIGAPDSYPSAFARLGDKVVFAASTPDTGLEPWVTDGTAAGTQPLGDLLPGPTGSLANQSAAFEFHVFKGQAYFQADGGPGINNELYRTDGTPGGTMLFDEIGGDDGNSDSADPAYFETMGDHLYFAASGLSAQGVELWRTDGTLGSSELVKDINPTSGSNPAELTALNGSLYFAATGSGVDRELYRSDGVSTTLLHDINPGPAGSSTMIGEYQFTEHAGRLYFRATTASDGAELWSTDGTTTTLVENITPGADSSFPGDFASAGGSLYFTAYSGAGVSDHELWRTDGTAAGTDEVAEIAAGPSSSNPQFLLAVGNEVYFAASGPNGNELWRSDGTAAGTREVADIVPGPTGSGPLPGDSVNGFLYFTATQAATTGTELWRTDGTSTGTALVEDYNPGPGAGASGLPFAFNDSIFLAGNNGAHGFELVRADDTTPPDTTITSGPGEGSTTDDTTPTFAFAADEASATFECSVDGAAFAACSGPADTHTTADLAPGAHTFSVRAVDNAGLADPTPAVRNFNLAEPPHDDDPADTAVLDPFVKAKKEQKQKDELIVKVKLGAGELVNYVAKGKATVDGEKGGAKLAKESGAVDAGKRVKLKLEAAKSDAGDEFLEAIADGEKTGAKLKVKLTDQAGNVFKKKLKITLK